MDDQFVDSSLKQRDYDDSCLDATSGQDGSIESFYTRFRWPL
jgi:hypothetical protein